MICDNDSEMVRDHLAKMAALPNPLNTDLVQGFTVSQVEQKHGWPGQGVLESNHTHGPFHPTGTLILPRKKSRIIPYSISMSSQLSRVNASGRENFAFLILFFRGSMV